MRVAVVALTTDPVVAELAGLAPRMLEVVQAGGRVGRPSSRIAAASS